MMKENDKRPLVLLVEDESTLAMIIKDTLEAENFDVLLASDGLKGLASFDANRPDVVIADVMMPQMDGFEMVRRIRKKDDTTPVLFLTARSSTDDLVQGFELGANDYLKKPFKMIELVIRIKALTHRVMVAAGAPEKHLFEIGSYVFDSKTQLLRSAIGAVELSYLESEILKRLCSSMGQVVEIDTVLTDLWHDNSFCNRNSLHGFIHKLRKLLIKDTHVKILNVRGVGYKLVVLH